MKQEDLTGAKIDRFCYDTPTCPQQDFYDLSEDDRPLMLVFLPNYGHPISRVYLSRYADTLDALCSGRLACVVHSDPQIIAQNLNGDFPFSLICDADGVLYDYFNVESTTSRFSWSIEAAKIFHDAEKQGFRLEKDAPQQLPLTLVIGRGGQVLFSHYGQSLTDMPDDCGAIERVCAGLMKNISLTAQDADAAQEPPEADEPAQMVTELYFAGNAEEDAAQEADEEAPAPAKTPAFPAQQVEAACVHTASAPVPEPEEEDFSAPLPMEEDDTAASAPAPNPSPENAASWDKLVGLFAEKNR